MLKLEKIWEKYEVAIKLNHNYHQHYIIEILKRHDIYKEKAKHIRKSPSTMCSKASDLLLETEITLEDIKNIEKLMKSIQEYELNLKKGFTCLICDYDHRSFIDFEDKKLFLDKSVCENFVESTFDYFYKFNNFIWKYINTVNILAMCNTTHDYSFKLNKEKRFEFI